MTVVGDGVVVKATTSTTSISSRIITKREEQEQAGARCWCFASRASSSATRTTSTRCEPAATPSKTPRRRWTPPLPPFPSPPARATASTIGRRRPRRLTTAFLAASGEGRGATWTAAALDYTATHLLTTPYLYLCTTSPRRMMMTMMTTIVTTVMTRAAAATAVVV